MFLKCINVYFSSAVFVIETLIKNLNEATVLHILEKEGISIIKKKFVGKYGEIILTLFFLFSNQM